MTNDELNAIRKNHEAFKHWYSVSPEIQPMPYSESIGPTIEVLLKALDHAREALRFYADANYQLDISQETQEQFRNRIYNDRGHRARKALGE